VPCDWDTALDAVAAGIERARSGRLGNNGVGLFGGGGLTNEKAYMLGKFARVAVGTANIDYNGRWCMSSAAAAGQRSFGADRGVPFPLSDLGAAQAVCIFGGNVAETMPPFMQHLQTAADAGGLIVADPRLTPTAQRALDGGGLHLALRPGTDAALALGMLHIAVVENMIKKEYIATRTTGFDGAWQAAARWPPERAERKTGVSMAAITRAVEVLWRAAERRAGAYVLSARGTEQQSTGTDSVSALIGLALALGLPGRPRSGFGTITGQGNGQGGREHGQKADQLPGYRTITDPVARRHVANVWGIDENSLPQAGRSAYELLESLGTASGPSFLMVHGSNIAVSAPASARVGERLSALDMLVVCDFVMSETAALADVVLPVCQWAEEDGTMTNLEGRVLRRRRALDPPPGVHDELVIWQQLAVRLGQPAARFPTDAETVFDELRRASAGGVADYSAVDYARLDDGDALHWPASATRPDGTPRLFLDRFATPDGRARFFAVDADGPAEQTSGRYPLWATTGRVLAHYQSGAQTRRIADLVGAAPTMFVQVHPDTAARAGLSDGDAALVVSRRGATRAVVRCDESMRYDTVFLPFHWSGAHRANLITNPALDPVSGMPEFKACAVRLEAAA
jgi:assimilatory nitrate reductase catalytic subunit